jgi:hypothetical protein
MPLSAEPLDVSDQDATEEAWTAEIASRVDDIITGEVQSIPHDEVVARVAKRRTARQVRRHA